MIKLVTGDATEPRGEGVKIIAHICNNVGKWGKGFVLALSKKWPVVRQEYINYGKKNGYQLGQIQLIQVTPEIIIANMFAQEGTSYNLHTHGIVAPIRYEALKSCLILLKDAAMQLNASIHMPKIGSGLAGGDFNKILLMLAETLESSQTETTIYSLP